MKQYQSLNFYCTIEKTKQEEERRRKNRKEKQTTNYKNNILADRILHWCGKLSVQQFNNSA